jgi:hypothetical protein
MNKIRIPIEQYSFIELDFEGSAEETLNEYRRLTQMATGGTGIDTKDFNAIIDQTLSEKPFVGDDIMAQIEKMNIGQQETLQAIKRSKARLKAKGVVIEIKYNN